MAMRTINHPDVEIREIDKSQSTPAMIGTNSLVMGFASKGEKYNPMMIATVQDLETNFGTPTNEAERYFYYACREVLNERGNLLAIKLPYNNDMESSYKGIGINVELSGESISMETSATTIFNNIKNQYPESTSANVESWVGMLSALNEYKNGFQGISALDPETITMTAYDAAVSEGYVYETSLDNIGSEFAIVCENKATKGGTAENEGVFVTVVSPFQGLVAQRIIGQTESDPMVMVNPMDGITSYSENLSAQYIGSSISETMMRYFPSFEFTNDGVDVSTDTKDFITVVVSKTSTNDTAQTVVTPVETFTGSLIYGKKDPGTGKSTYIGDIINGSSTYIKFLRRSAIPFDSVVGTLYASPQAISLMNFSSDESQKDIPTSVNTLIDAATSKVANIREYQIDMVVDAGLSTINQMKDGNGDFDPANTKSTIPTDSDDTTNWRATCASLINFAAGIRQDCAVILDAPRFMTLTADKKILRKTAPDNTFSNAIAPGLKFITGIGSNFAALYLCWMRVNDQFSGLNFWLPPSIKMAGIYTRVDRVSNYWDAPAGLTRGVLGGVSDISLNPTGKDADQIYPKGINYAYQHPVDGFIAEGQRTTQTRPSAFDRMNVRRLFLRLERYARQVADYYVDEPNNITTRRNLVAAIDPEFSSAKGKGGLYDYMIKCDETNNTSEVIDRNELKVAILMKPTRTAEFILIDVVAVKTSDDMAQIAQQVL